MQDALLHWETLLVVTSGDTEDVALEFVSKTVTWNFGRHTFVVKDTDSSLIFNLNKFLTWLAKDT